MEKSASQNDPETTFFCHLCSVSCASALNLQSHFLGIKHRKAEEAIRDNKIDKEEPIEKPIATLQEQIDACKNSEPALGLEYIYQYQKHGYNTYECKLCECRSGLIHMFMHIVGAKHRIHYLSKHHPSLGICGRYIMSGPKKLKKLKDVCLTVEKKFGRQKINVLEDGESQWPFNSDITGASSEYYTPDSELKPLDFTTDDYFDIDGKPAASEHVVTFLELKAAYEANLKTAACSKESITRDTEEGKQTKDIEKKVKGTIGEPCESDQEFTNNKDLLDFLEHFRILKDGDVKFVITVIEMLSIALLRHKRGSKENEENKLSVSKSDATREQGKKQNSMHSVSPHANQDPESQSKEELHSVSELEKSGPLTGTNPLTFSESTPGTPQDSERQSKKMLLPISQSVLGERKKLLFKISSKKAQALKNPAPQVNRRAPLDQTRFASPHSPFPPRVASRLFPIAKDDILNKFFESIKNMEVAEVISTLNIITATNPAFKGIHVPSLIHYLRETGKLKSSQSMQQMNQ